MKVILVYILFWTLVFPRHLIGQNLIQNGSFEDTICIDEGWNVPLYDPILHWYNPNGATPDKYTTSIDSIPCYFTSIYDPDLLNAGEWQYPQDGNHMIALWCGDGSSITREFLATKLTEPLTVDSTYCLSMYVSLGNRQALATDRIGAFFTSDSLYNLDSPGWFEIENYVTSPEGNFLTDTVEWMHIFETYVATGNEEFMMIGNSFDNENSNFIELYDGDGWGVAKYFVDNVQLFQCNVINGLTPIELNLSTYPNPLQDVLFVSSSANMKWNLISDFGQIVKAGTLSIGRNEINVSELSNGNYLFQYWTSNASGSKRIVLVN